MNSKPSTEPDKNLFELGIAWVGVHAVMAFLWATTLALIEGAFLETPVRTVPGFILPVVPPESATWAVITALLLIVYVEPFILAVVPGIAQCLAFL